jgi:hypothetical protein
MGYDDTGSDWVLGISALGVGLAVLTMGLFPFAIPIVVLTIAVLIPLALPVIALGVLAAVGLVVWLVIRTAGRAVARLIGRPARTRAPRKRAEPRSHGALHGC